MNDRPQANGTDTGGSGPARDRLLGIYLNDHLAGAAAVTDRARSLAAALSETPSGPALHALARESAEDRGSLLGIMRALGVPVRRHKLALGRTAERLGRLKSNGRLVSRSPLTSLVELEALRLGVLATSDAWRTLRRLAETDGRLDARLLDGLLARAERRQAELEELCRRQVTETFARA
ncbi:hypothetical protein [Streptomyces cinereospinus]|uniref:Uncharacterized protein n=1 Tax=Streptomyces cinereospinus TaxID=285561 RepID=A0ABV5N8B9_9ACTN